MPTSTTKFKFYKYNTSTDGDIKFNFNTSLNDNWDRIETNVAITLYNDTTNYKKDDCVLSPTDFRIYYSLVNNNLGNSLIDTAKWKEVRELPSQSGNSGKFLTTNGTTASWGSIDLSGKADVDLSNVPTSKGILIEKGLSTDGTVGYRKYADGFIEQWGTGTGTSNGVPVVFDFLTAFTTTSYNFQLKVSEASAGYVSLNTDYYSIEKQTNKATALYGIGGAHYEWYAVGY